MCKDDYGNLQGDVFVQTSFPNQGVRSAPPSSQVLSSKTKGNLRTSKSGSKDPEGVYHLSNPINTKWL